MKNLLWIISIILMATISFNLYPDIIKVKKSKPKKSKTEQQIWYEMQERPTKYKYVMRES